MPRTVGGWKICSKCRENKPVSEFWKSRHQPDGLHNQCKVCARAASKEDYKKHREARLARQTAYNHSARGRTTNLRYYRTEKGQATLRRNWQSEKGQHSRRRRRVQQADAEGHHTRGEFEALCKECEHRCLACGKEFLFTFGERLVADHVVPISKGGSDNIDNIQPLCRSCNSIKGAQTIDYRKRVLAVSV